MTAPSTSRRRVVAALGSLSVLGSTAGRVADDPGSGSRAGSPTDDRGSATATTSPDGDTPASVEAVSVADGARATATVEVNVRNVGEGEAATVGLDWGPGRWSADVPVVEGVGTGEGTATGTAGATGADALPSR